MKTHRIEQFLSGWKYYLVAISMVSLMLFTNTQGYFVYFGLLLTVSLSIHWLWEWAELPFLGSSLPLMAGGFVVSAITTRVTYFLAGFGNVSLLPWNGSGWIENSEANVALVNEWLRVSPLTSIVLIVLSLGTAFVIGGLAGWLMVKPSLGKGKAFVAITSYVLVDLGSWIALRVTEISGGYYGVYVPNLFIFSGDNNLLGVVGLVLFVVFFGLYGYNRLRGSRFGLEVQSSTDASVLGRAVFLGCGLIGVAGCILSFYSQFVVQANFVGSWWGLWVLLVFLISGSRGGTGVIMGVLGLMVMQYLVQLNRTLFSSYIFFPVAYVGQIEMGLVILLSCYYYQKERSKKELPYNRNLGYGKSKGVFADSLEFIVKPNMQEDDPYA